MDRKNIADTRFGEARRSLFATAATASVVARPFISAAQTAMKFEFAMSKVGAIANATGPELTLLTQTARSLGEQTKFTATQSAEAMSYLGMAGWKTKEIVAGMPGLLNLAAAGNTDLARTADIVSDNLTAFGLSADKAQHMADVYAVTITSTNTNVEMLGETPPRPLKKLAAERICGFFILF
ncbi:phage tail tape measure protein [Phascolarctobacterium faecium]|uniref:phage tail tape measure protein n=1 Tax=Phascolarctobacterium faecium TaxID=33025 RepID=UPI003AB42F01